jgi:hypothetical protein
LKKINHPLSPGSKKHRAPRSMLGRAPCRDHSLRCNY